MFGGSGSGGSIPGGTRDEKYNCANVNERTLVDSPIAAVLGKCNLGDTLSIEVQNGTLVVRHNGLLLGSLNFLHSIEMIECIENGFSYEAEIVELSNSLCRVQIRNV